MQHFPKYLAALLLSFTLRPARAQQPQFAVHRLPLPKELAYYDNQFSGLYIGKGQLFIMSESRLQDKAEAKLYTVPLADLDQQLADTTHALPFQKLPLQNLALLRAKIDAAGQRYEGLEAMVIDRDEVYFSVETTTPSSNCYLLKGRLHAAAVVLDTTFLLPLPKPLAPDNSHVYNAGFEALALTDKHLLAFFEYNYFPGPNYVYELDRAHLRTGSLPRRVPLAKVPFRITDVTPSGKQHFTAINFFFKGDGDDAVYRTPATDTTSSRLIGGPGGYRNYCRLLAVTRTSRGFSWQPLWELPLPYWGYNWEGLAAYKNGYFLINDKYTPSRPYRTTLLYVQKTK